MAEKCPTPTGSGRFAGTIGLTIVNGNTRDSRNPVQTASGAGSAGLSGESLVQADIENYRAMIRSDVCTNSM